MGSEAKVRTATAKTDVFIGISQDIKGVRIIKNLWISVSRVIPKDHLLTLGNELSADLRIGGSAGATKMNHRSRPANYLFHCARRYCVKIVEPNFTLLRIIS